MARKHYNIPSLTMLAAFEAAARQKSFKLGAHELNVTPGAISHQIKALEAELGATLFVRVHRGVELNAAGEQLYSALSSSFSAIGSAVHQIRQTGQDRSVTILVSTAVSTLWLTPRLAAFWREFPDIPINQHVSDDYSLFSGHMDLHIRYGHPDRKPPIEHALFRDTLIPLCSPEFAQSIDVTDLTTLAAKFLIHLRGPDDRWMTWHTWFKELGYSGTIATGIHVNNYMIALQAACDGAGIVLGWKQLVKPMLDSGALIPFCDHKMRAPSAFHFVSETDEHLSEEATKVREWLISSV